VALALSSQPSYSLPSNNNDINNNQLKTLSFSGYEWTVRDSQGRKEEPGNNIFEPNNTYVDTQGKLHLMLTKASDGVWRSAQVDMNLDQLGFGTYSVYFDTQVHHFGDHDNRGDPHVVLGVWLHNSKDKMIHMDFARWGETGTNSPNGDFCVNAFTLPQWNNCRGEIHINSYEKTVHKIEYKPNSLMFSSYLLDSQYNEVQRYTLWQVEPSYSIPSPDGLRVRMNLFFFKGRPHSALPLSSDLDVAISKFTFVPYQEQSK